MKMQVGEEPSSVEPSEVEHSPPQQNFDIFERTSEEELPELPSNHKTVLFGSIVLAISQYLGPTLGIFTISTKKKRRKIGKSFNTHRLSIFQVSCFGGE